jgi:hypothetical protein
MFVLPLILLGLVVPLQTPYRFSGEVFRGVTGVQKVVISDFGSI